MLNPQTLENFAQWQWMNYGMSKDFLENFIARYPETKDAPTTYATLGEILEALKSGERYARVVMEYQEMKSAQGARFRRLFKKHGIQVNIWQ